MIETISSNVTRRRQYFPHVEGLRGLTALYVFFYHMRQAVSLNPAFIKLVHLTPFLGFGHYAVSIFIVISGYCLASPLARNPDRQFNTKSFAVRRFRRIYPAYAGALIVSVLVFFYWAPANFHHASPLGNIALAFVAHAFLIHNLLAKTTFYLNGPMWSVGAEAQIYFVFAVLLVPLWKRFGVLVQLAVALGLGLAPHFLFKGVLDWTCPWFLGLFAMGICAAHFSERQSKNGLVRSLAITASVTTIAIIALSGTLETFEGDFGGYLVTDLLVGISLALFLMSAADVRGKLWAPARLLAQAPFAWLGTFAYSLYLLHWVAIMVTLETIRRLHLNQVESLITYAMLVPATLAFSYGFFALLERPFMSDFLHRAIATSNFPEVAASIPATLA